MYRSSRLVQVVAARAYSQGSSGGSGSASNAPKSSTTIVSGGTTSGGINSNVPGLSSKCVKPVSGPVGPGAAPNAIYKVPEYFCFDRYSFSEAEVEMAKYRCPQPSALKK